MKAEKMTFRTLTVAVLVLGVVVFLASGCHGQPVQATGATAQATMSPKAVGEERPCTKCKCKDWMDVAPLDSPDGKCDNSKRGAEMPFAPYCQHKESDHE